MVNPNRSGRSLTPLEQDLVQQGSALFELSQTEGWIKHLKPWLEAHIRNSWVNPKGKDKEELVWEYTQAYMFAEACQGIVDFVDKQIDEGVKFKEIADGKRPEPFREALS